MKADIKSTVSGKALASEVNEPAPLFSLKSLDGGMVELANYRGRVVLVDFWATWCGPCNLEMPVLEKIYREYSEKGLSMAAVSLDSEKTVEEVPAFIEKRNLTMTVLYDDGKTPSDYEVKDIPALFVIDKKGNIRFKHVGYSKDLLQILKFQVEYLLNE